MRFTASRRGFLGTLGAVAASFGMPLKLFGAKDAAPSSPLTGFGQSGNPYEELGVPTVINAQGTMTMLGGSLIRPEVEAVMAQATRHFVSIPGLEAAAGKKIAQMLKLPAGYSVLVTSGAAGAIQSGLAGILTGDNELVTQHICSQVELDSGRIVLGTELDQISDPALAHIVEQTSVFARVSPAKKNRIILRLKERSHEK